MFLVNHVPHSAFPAHEPFSFVTDTVEKAKAFAAEKLGQELDFNPSIVGNEKPYFENDVEYQKPIYDTTGENIHARTDNRGYVWIKPIEVI